jgi:hypothetical protein
MAPRIPAKLAVDLANALSRLRLARKVQNQTLSSIAEDQLNCLIERIPR